MISKIACMILGIALVGIRKLGVDHAPGFFFGPLSFGALIAPTIGFFAGPSACLGVWLIRTAALLCEKASLGAFFVYIPTLCGALVLSSPSRALKVLIPLLCMILFIAHPVGRSSWIYTLYWLIPLGIGCISSPSVIARSIASTYTTHAVGSTLFLYSRTTSPDFWLMLVNQVWYERLCYALLLTACYYTLTFVQNFLSAVWSERNLCQIPLSSS